MSHTPGPWEIRKPKGPHDRAIVEHEIVGTYESPFVGAKEIKICGIHNQIDANAKLIAAAPELLEALQEIVAIYESSPAHGAMASSMVRIAKDAIAKATGEA